MVDKPRRVVMRLEVRPGTSEALGTATKAWGSTHITVASRAIEWFCQQNEVIQATILGLHPTPPAPEELIRAILQRMKISNGK